MPLPTRQSVPLNCRGINLAKPIDRLPPGDFPYLMNVRVLQQGSIEARPGQNPLFGSPMADLEVHSIRRLNDILSTTMYVEVIGAGSNLYTQTGAAAPVQVDGGYSGNPLSMIRYRPDQATASWMYIGDYLKMAKVDINGTMKNIGVAPPNVPPDAELTSAVYTVVSDTPAAAPWGSTGIAGAASDVARVPAATTISSILYDSGTTGFATASPSTSAGDSSWLGPGARLTIGGELVTVQQVLPPIDNSTIAGIFYDAGATGACTVVLASHSVKLARNSLVNIGGEVVRVISVTQGLEQAGGLPSFRCVTVGSFAAGAAVTGMVSFRFSSVGALAVGAAITANSVQFTLTPASPAFTGAIQLTSVGVNLFKYAPDDYMHATIWVDLPANIVSARLLLDVDATTNDFTQNYYEKDLTQNDFTTTGDNNWAEILFHISDLIRIGEDSTRSLANVAAISLELTVSDVTVVRLAAWWAGGTYGPDVLQGSPEGIVYRYRYRDSTTGAKSVPGPATRYQVFPLRQQVTLMVTASTDPQVDTIDIERLDPLLQSSTGPRFVYIRSTPNVTGSYADNISAVNVAANPPLETNVLQPFPILGVPLTGTASVAGTAITWLSGDHFPLNLVAGSVIRLGGVAYQTYGNPPSATQLNLTLSAGVSASVEFAISSPTLAGQGLPYLFGPLEGPTASFVFAIGDVDNPGTVYWTNGNDPDSAADTNFIEISPPSEPLVSGQVWNSYVFVGSRDRLWLLQPTFDQPNMFTPVQIPAASGFWSPWTSAAGIDGVYYLGRDGIYKATAYYGGQNISDDLWPIFPHEGKPGVITNGIHPPQMDIATSPPSLQPRVSVADSDVFFDYRDVQGNLHTLRSAPTNSVSLRQDQNVRGWFPYDYATGVNYHYWEESPFGTVPRLLELTQSGLVLESTGLADAGSSTVACTVRTPSMFGEDTRALKLYIDSITDMTGVADITIGFDWNQVTLPSFEISASPRGMAIADMDAINYSAPNVAINLPLFKNICAQWDFNPGTVLYEFQPSFYPQPYLVDNIVTQFTDHGIPGYKFERWARFAYISSTTLLLTITTSEGRTFQYTLPAHPLVLNTFDFNMEQLQKARMYAYDLRSPNCEPFVPFLEQTYIRMKKWGTGQELMEVQPFIK